MSDDNLRSLDARRRARQAAAEAGAKATTERVHRVRDRTLEGALAVVSDTITVLEAGGTTDAINGLRDLADRLAREIEQPTDCTSTVHAGPVHRHPSGIHVCTRCGAQL